MRLQFQESDDFFRGHAALVLHESTLRRKPQSKKTFTRRHLRVEWPQLKQTSAGRNAGVGPRLTDGSKLDSSSAPRQTARKKYYVSIQSGPISHPTTYRTAWQLWQRRPR